MSKSIIKRMREQPISYYKLTHVRASLKQNRWNDSAGVQRWSLEGTVSLPSGFVVHAWSSGKADMKDGGTFVMLTIDGRRYHCYISAPTGSHIGLRRLAVAFAERVIAGQLEGAKK